MRIAVAILLLALASGHAEGQAGRTSYQSRADSLRILKGAKAAQAQFESRRRFFAPRGYDGSGATCQLIGRFCHHASGISFSEIPEEPAGTTNARRTLLENLAASTAKLPGDDWIVGQRVRYLIEAHDDSSALDVARRCSATQWWCDALTGLALHASGRFAAAEQAFSRTLKSMSDAKRCEWTNLAVLLEGESLDRYRKLSCDARDAANRRIWWLADPFFSTPGNERRTEHFSRHVWSEIDRGGSNGFGLSWGPDFEEMIIRFGWAEKWTQREPSSLSYGSQSYVAHEREPQFHFLPAISWDVPLSAFTDSAWRLDDPLAREDYAPPYALSIGKLTPQIARFRRGDSTLVVAAFDVTGDTAWSYPGIRPALVIAPSDSSRISMALLDSTGRRSALWIATGAQEMLGSVEVRSLDGKAAGRWRSVIRRIAIDTGGPAISDILLFDATDSLASDLHGAIANALGNSVLPRDRKIGVYWETYGETPADSALPVSLSLTPVVPSLATRVIRALGVGKKLSPVDVRWRDFGNGGGIVPRSVLLDLSQVAPGRYELRLAIGDGGGGARSTSTSVVIEKGGARPATSLPDLRR